MFPNLEVRHLHAVIVLAEELNFTRAADRLHITQPALSKQITDLEAEHRFHLFTRDNTTGCGTHRCRTCLRRRGSLCALAYGAGCSSRSCCTRRSPDSVLTIGHSPYADHDWISAMLAIRLPLYPKLGIRLMTQFQCESVRSVLVGERESRLGDGATARFPDHGCAICSDATLRCTPRDPRGCSEGTTCVLKDLAKDKWILFAETGSSRLHDAIMDTARRESIAPKHAHDIIAATRGSAPSI